MTGIRRGTITPQGQKKLWQSYKPRICYLLTTEEKKKPRSLFHYHWMYKQRKTDPVLFHLICTHLGLKVYMIVNKILQFYQYKIKRAQKLRCNDLTLRVSFILHFFARIEVDGHCPRNILWTDTAHFHQNIEQP